MKSIGSPCSAFESGFETVKNIFKKTLFNFGKRRCRCIKICGSVVPFSDINMGNMDLDSTNLLNEWVKYLVPDFKVKLGDVPYIKSLLDGPSVANIREKMLNFVSNLFQTLLYLKYAKKFFILCSLIFLTLSPVRYLTNYYSNNLFDNEFIDDNVRKSLKRENHEKLHLLGDGNLKSIK